jgi:MFS family permease
LSTTVPALLAARLMMGVGSSASMSGTQAYLGDLTEKAPAHRGKLMAFNSTAINLAYAIGITLSPVI